MTKQCINQFNEVATQMAQTFVSRAKDVEKEADFFDLLADTEKAIYRDAADRVNEKLIKPLQKSSATMVLTSQPTFLNTSQDVDQQYIDFKTQSYMNSQNYFERQIFENANQINHIQHQEQHIQQNGLLQFPLYDRNFLDTNANSKFYHPPKHDAGLKDLPRQFTDQSNANLQLLKSTDHYNFENPDQKFLYPRGVIDNPLAAKPLPDFIAEREKNFKFKPVIDALGGYRDTINPMMNSLRANEQRNFISTPQHSLLQIAITPTPKIEPPPPPPDTVLPDPFSKNPQHLLYNMQPRIMQSQQQFEQRQQNYQQQPEVEPTRSAFLEQQKRLREQYSKKI